MTAPPKDRTEAPTQREIVERARAEADEKGLPLSWALAKAVEGAIRRHRAASEDFRTAIRQHPEYSPPYDDPAAVRHRQACIHLDRALAALKDHAREGERAARAYEELAADLVRVHRSGEALDLEDLVRAYRLEERVR